MEVQRLIKDSDVGLKEHIYIELDSDDVTYISTSKSELIKVLEIFPDADTEHIENLLEVHSNHQKVIEQMADKGYVKKSIRIESNCAIDFSVTTWDPSSRYKESAMTLLVAEFPSLHSNVITTTLVKNNYHYFHTKNMLDLNIKLKRRKYRKKPPR